jgi:hypothetical protein
VSMKYLQSFDKNMKRTGHLVSADQVTRKRRLNSDYELSFLVPMHSEDYTKKIVLKGHVIDERGQYYVINSRQRNRDGLKRMAQISCMHVMFKLTDIKFPYESYIEEQFNVPITTLTNLISAATGGKFTFSIDDTFDNKDVYDFGRGNCLEALNAILKLYECEVEPDNFKLHIRKKIGNPASDLQYRLKKNIISDSFTDDARALTTRMFAQMKDGLTFIDLAASNLTTEEYSLLNAVPGAIVGGLIKVNYLISPYAANWSNSTNTYYDNEIILQDIEDKLELLEATRKALRENEVPQLDINIKQADLHKVDYTAPIPNLGDYVQCVDPEMEMNNIGARIVELTEYPLDKSRHADVNLANFMKKDFTDIIADLDASKRIVDDLLSGGKLRADAFESFARQAVIDINNSKTQVLYDTRGIVLQSKSNPLHQVIHSSVGTILTVDGGATARVAITAQGIAAPYIVGILGEFAQVKTDNLIAGSALISSALIQSLKVEKLDASTAKITSAMIDTINANQINVGTLYGFSLVSSFITGGIITGSTVQTGVAGVYPRTAIMSDTKTFEVEGSATERIRIIFSGTNPLLQFFDNTSSTIVRELGGDFVISAQNGINLNSFNGTRIDGVHVLSAINSKANVFSGYSGSFVIDGAMLSFNNGVLIAVA